MPKVSDEHLEAKRRSILQAAVACFARDGFHNTTMSDIASMAGVSDGLAYRYFSGKDEIIEEVIRQAAGSTAMTTLEAVDADDAESMLRLLYSTSFERFSIPGRAATVGLRMRSWAEALDYEAVRAAMVERWDEYQKVVERLWANAQTEGLIPADLDARAVARVFLAIHDGLDLQWTLDPGTDTDECRKVLMALIEGSFSLGRDPA